jgi:ERCC4-type nuclease
MPDASEATILVSPAEPITVKNLLAARGDTSVSPLPERYGVDVMWRENGTWWGVQRKTVPDLLASLRDGRIAREVAQMTSKVAMPTLVIEGRVQFTTDGVMLNGGYGPEFTLKQWRGLLWSFASEGVTVGFTATVVDTCNYIAEMVQWTSKAKHTSLTQRPKTVDAAWGKPGSRDWGVFLLQSFDGIGAGIAGDIYDHFGRVPLRWDVTKRELMEVKGLGKTRVERMMGALS